MITVKESILTLIDMLIGEGKSIKTNLPAQGIVTLTELIKAGLISSQTQNKAYVAFENVKTEIAKCKTIEEVQKYLVE